MQSNKNELIELLNDNISRNLSWKNPSLQELKYTLGGGKIQRDYFTYSSHPGAKKSSLLNAENRANVINKIIKSLNASKV